MAATALSTRWFDGRQPRAQVVRIRIDGDALVLLSEDTEALLRRYPLSQVRWPERRSHGQRQTDLPDGSLLQHEDSAQWDRWWADQGLREPAVVGWMQSWRTTLGAVGATMFLLVVGWQWGVPLLSSTVAHSVPAGLEARIGRQGMEQLERVFLAPSEIPLAEQQAIRERFTAAVHRAFPDGRVPRWQLSFHASRALGANAFALPGGQIVVTDALVQLLRDAPDVITGVLAHELGHVEHRHGLDMMVRAGLVGAVVGVVLGDASGFLAAIPATLLTQSYSRDAEREADEFAAFLLDRAGIAPAVMATFFERMQRGAAPRPGDAGAPRGPAAELPIAISSHPDAEERIRFFRSWR